MTTQPKSVREKARELVNNLGGVLREGESHIIFGTATTDVAIEEISEALTSHAKEVAGPLVEALQYWVDRNPESDIGRKALTTFTSQNGGDGK